MAPVMWRPEVDPPQRGGDDESQVEIEMSGAMAVSSWSASMIALAEASRLSPRTMRVKETVALGDRCGCQGVVPASLR